MVNKGTIRISITPTLDLDQIAPRRQEDNRPHTDVRPQEASMIRWNTSLIRQYGGPGPRYTSYPPATSFHADISEEDFWLALDEGNVARRPLSLYMHIPF